MGGTHEDTLVAGVEGGVRVLQGTLEVGQLDVEPGSVAQHCRLLTGRGGGGRGAPLTVQIQELGTEVDGLWRTKHIEVEKY